MVARRAHNPKVVGSNPAPATSESLFNRIEQPIGVGTRRCTRGLGEVVGALIREGWGVGCWSWVERVASQ